MVSTTDKLLKGLSGKDAFKLVMSNYLEERAGKTPTFSDGDIAKVIHGLSGRSTERSAYYHWGEAYDVIYTLQAEVRLAAMDAVWRLSVFAQQIGEHVCQFLKGQGQEVHCFNVVEEYHSAITQMQESIISALKCNMMLQAFDEVLDLDVSSLTQREMTLLSQHIGTYNKMVEYFNHQIAFDNNTAALPYLTMESAALPSDLKQRFIDTIKRAHGTSVWQVINMLAC